MTTIKLMGAGGKQLASIAFDGLSDAPRIQSASHVDSATLHNALLLALVTCVARMHPHGGDVSIPVPGVAGPLVRKV